MIFNHCGLYFGDENIRRAQKSRLRPPFIMAWHHLDTEEQSGSIASIQQCGLRYRFNEDVAAGEEGIQALEAATLDTSAPIWDAITRAMALAQCFEMLRTHPDYAPDAQAQWRETFSERVNHLNQISSDGLSLAETLWLAALNVTAGIVLEQEAIFEVGASVYRQIVNEDIHPEGYILKAVESGDNSLENQLRCVQALVLMAEAADHVGVDLWLYDQRGVSVLTAAAYPLYYYFYPEKWPWEEGLQLEDSKQIFRRNSGFLEIINWRYDRGLRAIQMILDELRPVYDVYGGGLTTLTHGVPGRRGLLG